MPPETSTPLPLHLLRRVDAVCDAFDSAWQRGQRPAIDRFLPHVEEPARPLLLAELIRTELEWRCRHGEQPSTREYVERFPACGTEVSAWLDEAQTAGRLWNPPPSTASLTPTPEPFDVPDTVSPLILGEYELLGLLGKGGMGEVWKARHRRLDKLVALKRLLSGPRLTDARARARFLQEMRAVGRLDHPNLIEAHDAGECEGTVYLVMKLVEGQDLARLLHDRGPLPVSEACALMQQVAVGLQYLHEQGLVHRDLKPSNLMRLPDGTVKILDFGLARLQWDSPADGVTPEGQMMGTPDYVAPEQITGATTVDVRADLYSLGATLFHLLTGQPPFAHKHGLWPKLDAHRGEPPPDPQQLRPEIPSPLAELIARLLAKRPEDRPQTPAEVAAALTLFTTTEPHPQPSSTPDRPQASQPQAVGREMRSVSAVSLLLRALALQIDVLLIAGLLLAFLAIWQRGWPDFRATGVMVRTTVLGWGPLALIGLALLALRALFSPGRWLLDVHFIHLRSDGPPQPLSFGRRLLSGLSQYLPLLFAAHILLNSAVWFPGGDTRAGAPLSGRSYGPGDWFCVGVAFWLAMNGLVLLLRQFVDTRPELRSATLVELLLDIGLIRFPPGKVERFLDLLAELEQETPE